MSANILKLIALISMTIDHVGYFLFPEQEWMRIVGRISFPIFAYMISEGCRYTKNRRRYLLKIAGIGIVMQLVSYVVSGSLYQSVFITFTLSIGMIYLTDMARTRRRIEGGICVLIAAVIIGFLCITLPQLLPNTDYAIDYSIVGVAIPVICYLIEDARMRLLAFGIGLLALSIYYGGVQWYCLLAILFIAAYNRKRGKLSLKNLFYYYYPAHLCVIYAVQYLMQIY